jgi:hypothetical protein
MGKTCLTRNQVSHHRDWPKRGCCSVRWIDDIEFSPLASVSYIFVLGAQNLLQNFCVVFEWLIKQRLAKYSVR